MALFVSSYTPSLCLSLSNLRLQQSFQTLPIVLQLFTLWSCHFMHLSIFLFLEKMNVINVYVCILQSLTPLLVHFLCRRNEWKRWDTVLFQTRVCFCFNFLIEAKKGLIVGLPGLGDQHETITQVRVQVPVIILNHQLSVTCFCCMKIKKK